MVEGSDKGVSVSILGGRYGSFGLDDGIDASHYGRVRLYVHAIFWWPPNKLSRTSMSDLSGNLEEDVVLDLTGLPSIIALLSCHGDKTRGSPSEL